VNKALLDTDIDSEVLKAIDPTVERNAATYRQQHGFLTLSAVTLMEIVRGYQRKRSARRLQAFLNAVALEEVLDFNRSAAELAGRIAGELEYVGRPIGNADSMIAAIALEHGLELATGNTSHFQRVQQLGYPLTLVNWRV
jgi:tRNA(fMet)-specific endonuclease VapC